MRGRAVGVDESIGMLRVACRERPKVPVAAAQVIDLPFGPGRFDAAIGSFVLAHFNKVETALFDIARVLRVGGRVGFTSWTDGVDAYQQAWREMVESVVPREMLAPAYAEAAPWHERFRSRTNVEETLIDAGFRSVRTEVVKYHWTYALDDYLDGLQVWATGRFVRNMLGESGWESLRGPYESHVRGAVPRSAERLPRGHHRDGDEAGLTAQPRSVLANDREPESHRASGPHRRGPRVGGRAAPRGPGRRPARSRAASPHPPTPGFQR